jgi:hypothetical protein
MSTKKVYITNRFPGIKVLAHKDTFGDLMELCKVLAPDHYKFVPFTFNLPNEREMARFREYQS